MIQAPSRYTRVVRAIAMLAAFCGLGYFFLVTIVPDHFGPNKEDALETASVNSLPRIPDPVRSLKPVLMEGLQSEEDEERSGHEYERTGSSQKGNQGGISTLSIDCSLWMQEQIQVGGSTGNQHHHHHQQEQKHEGLTASEYEGDHEEAMLFHEGHNSHDLSHIINPAAREQATCHQIGRANGVLVMLVHEDHLQEARETIRQVEDRFNRDRDYSWVVLSPIPLTNRSQTLVRHLSKRIIAFGTIPHDQWRLPTWVQAAKVRSADYAKMRLGMNETSLMTRHRWRYMSGFLARHELLDPYEFFWRVDPGVEIFCDIHDDPMVIMKSSGQNF
ncbi:alpha 1,2-mannosyltransferase 2.4.1, partial [Modicella reniformis]